MIIRFEGRFRRDLQSVRDKSLLKKVKQIIGDSKNADDSRRLTGLKKIKGFENYYRFKVGDYRVGIEINGDEIIFVRFLHRREVYRFFP